MFYWPVGWSNYFTITDKDFEAFRVNATRERGYYKDYSKRIITDC